TKLRSPKGKRLTARPGARQAPCAGGSAECQQANQRDQRKFASRFRQVAITCVLILLIRILTVFFCGLAARAVRFRAVHVRTILAGGLRTLCAAIVLRTRARLIGVVLRLILV